MMGVPCTIESPPPWAVNAARSSGSRTRMPTSAAVGMPMATARAFTVTGSDEKMLLKLRRCLYSTITSA